MQKSLCRFSAQTDKVCECVSPIWMFNWQLKKLFNICFRGRNFISNIQTCCKTLTRNSYRLPLVYKSPSWKERGEGPFIYRLACSPEMRSRGHSCTICMIETDPWLHLLELGQFEHLLGVFLQFHTIRYRVAKNLFLSHCWGPSVPPWRFLNKSLCQSKILSYLHWL